MRAATSILVFILLLAFALWPPIRVPAAIVAGLCVFCNVIAALKEGEAAKERLRMKGYD